MESNKNKNLSLQRNYLTLNIVINTIINFLINALFGSWFGLTTMPLYGVTSILTDILWMAPLLSFLVALTVTQNTRKDFLKAKVPAPAWRRKNHPILKYLPKNDYLRALVFMIAGWILFPLLIIGFFTLTRISHLEYSIYILYKGLFGGIMACIIDLIARISILGDMEVPTDPEYHPNLVDIKRHTAPTWFHDAKLGIFIHWGLYSVPAYAHKDPRILTDIAKEEGMEAQFKKTPYAEWYLNTLRIEGSSTQEYHKKSYGPDFAYDDFAPQFNSAIKKWKPEEWAELFQKSGAKYSVLTSKHGDGFLLWPSVVKNPKKPNYFANRDIVGELTDAVRAKGLKMGLYYVSPWDWTFTTKPIIDAATFITNGPTSKEHNAYVDAHWKELIDRYQPSILWSDIAYPPGMDVNKLFAYYYNKVADGVLNDRWKQTSKLLQKIIRTRPFSTWVNKATKKYIQDQTSLIKPPHYDYLTPEYTSFKEIQEEKWETCRGLGRSFGYNQFEPDSNYLTTKELIHLLIDIVSKNGNLLLNIGPKADGTISDIQKDRLLGLGRWLKVNGEAIYETRPWEKAEGLTTDGIELRYTRKGEILYIILLGTPRSAEILIESLKISQGSAISWIGVSGETEWSQSNGNLHISVPGNLAESDAYVIKITLGV
jgi:alpha-L-fucosidase